MEEECSETESILNRLEELGFQKFGSFDFHTKLRFTSLVRGSVAAGIVEGRFLELYSRSLYIAFTRSYGQWNWKIYYREEESLKLIERQMRYQQVIETITKLDRVIINSNNIIEELLFNSNLYDC